MSNNVAVNVFADGNGTAIRPYLIMTKEHLQNLSTIANFGISFSFIHFALGNDIILNDTTGWQNWADVAPANSWTAIRGFSGTFDGAGFVVAGVYINNSNSFQGLFGFAEGAIKNLGVVASYVKGSNNVGGLVGIIRQSVTITNSYFTGNVSGESWVGGLVGESGNGVTITNSYATGNVSGTGGSIGGLVGITRGNGGTITNSYATGNVSGESGVGGLVGVNVNTITNSYATGNVTGTGGNIGGLIGNSSNCTITNSYAAGNVTGTGGNISGLIGYIWNNTVTITNSYYNSETAGAGSRGTPRTEAEMKQQTTYTNWNFTGIWAIRADVNNGYPYLRVFKKDYNISGSWFANKIVTYNGEEQNITMGGTLPLGLTVLSYSGNNQINAGTYTVTPNFATSNADYNLPPMLTATLTINKAELTITAENKSVIYGSPAPEYTVEYSGFVGGDTRNSLGGTPTFACGYTTSSNVGNYNIVPSGLTSNNYNITFVPGTLSVDRKALTGAIVAVDGTYTYTTAAQTPAAANVTVTLEGYTPTYDIEVSNNTNAGTATVTVTGIGNFSGTAEGTFTISPRSLTGATISVDGSYTYTGTAQTPTSDNVAVTLEGYTPTYNIEATNNTNAGTATVTVIGTGNFTGIQTGIFTIQQKPLTADMLNIPEVIYNGLAQTPILTVIDDTKTLLRNTDYAVILTPQTNANTYPVTVTGTGNYTGTPSIDFVINPKILTAEMLSIPSVVFNGTAQAPVLTVTDHDIGVLTRNTHYTVTLTPQTNLGSYPVIVTGMGNYTGTPSVNFVITDGTISVLSPDRVIPPSTLPNQEGNNSFSNVLTSEFTAGPNPVTKSARSVTFFRQGKRIQSATLNIFDPSGNVINKVKITDNALNTQDRRPVGSWDLKDAKGRTVTVGTYLVRGVIITSDGKRERVSVMVGVR